uniref:TrbG/VirB9 family P-type conjugative transfer protein n=1 Tax=Parerythrobacter lutipelagi TaxID=1964208 RepID=UPI0010F94C81|nr:TrbG/VirB9 family P-type conjugative transfer protein [Parerythrobacter lutipelagi]
MIRLIALLLLLSASPAAGQLVPLPQSDSPRLQEVTWQAGETILLTTLPETGLTVMLEPGEQVQRIVVGTDRVFDVRVSADLDSFQVFPLVTGAESTMSVSSDRRDYSFELRTGEGLMAALLVRLRFGTGSPIEAEALQAERPTGRTWRYRLRGDTEVRPAAISDDGIRTRIEFAPDQALPAVFAIGPTGDEQVVDGYMRGGIFVIDRVWEELVFRIDKEKATARRSADPEPDDV